MEKTKTNFEKLKELKDWELAQIMDLAFCHVEAILKYPKAQVSDYDHSREYLRWLNQPYDEEKGFKFLLDDDSNEETYITLQELRLKKEKQIFKGILNKEELNTSKQPERTLGKYLGDYLIFRRTGSEIQDFFAEDGTGYTENPAEAGIFTVQEVEYFNAEIIDYEDLLLKKQKKDYAAISVVTLLTFFLSFKEYTECE